MKKLFIYCSALFLLMSHGFAIAVDRVSEKLWDDHQSAQEQIIQLWLDDAAPEDFKPAFSKLTLAELNLMGGGRARLSDTRFIGSSIKNSKNYEGGIDFIKAAYLLMKIKVSAKTGKRLDVDDIFKGRRFSVYLKPQVVQKSVTRQGERVQ